ncbi:DUF4184 family protein [Nocardioidaceae bacterium]|nr:DUF4184 family protein [Nocardioidaceae bacterium]
MLAPLIAGVLVAAWIGVVRDALVDMAPDGVRERLDPRSGLSALQIALVLPAAALGAATHVMWDSFTHEGRWGVELLPFLDGTYGPLPGYRWAQYASGAVGSLVLVVAAAVWLRGRPRRPRPRRVPVLGDRALMAGGGGVVLAVVVSAISDVTDGFHAVAYGAAITTMAASAVVVLSLSLAWQGFVRRAPAGSEQKPT